MNLTTLGWPAWAAGFAALAGGLYLLQRLRTRHRPVTVPTAMFWRAAAEAAPARTLTERFRHPWAYLFILLILALLWLAFADPRFAVSRDQTFHVAVLDGSAAMAAGDRFDRAVAALRTYVRTLPAEQRQVLWSGGRVETLLAPGEHELLLDERLKTLRPEAAPARMDAVLRSLASEVAANRPVAVTIFGDAEVVTTAALPPGLQVTRLTTGVAPARNQGVVALGVEEAASGQWTAVDVYIEVALTEGTPARPRVTVDETELPADAVRAVPSAPGRAGFLLSDLPANGGLLRARVAGGDALVLDDEAKLRLPLRTKLKVQLSPSLAVLRPALVADPAVELVETGAVVAIRRRGEAVGPDLPALEFGPRADQPAFVIVHPETIAERPILQEAVEAIGLRDFDATELATTAQAVIEISARPGAGWSLQVWEELLAQPYTFTRSRAFPLFLANAVRWLGGAAGVAPELAAGRPWRRAAADTARHPKTAKDVLLDPLGDAFAPEAAGEIGVEGSARPAVASLLDADSTRAPARTWPAAPIPASVSGLAPPALWILGLALVLLLIEWRLHRNGRLP